MKPIILLGIVAIASIAMGTGFLTNTISLDVMELGVGEETLVSPIDNADVKFDIQTITGNQNNFKNVIKFCEITNTDADDDILPQSKIWCKLTDENGYVVVEGMKTVVNTIEENDMITVMIDDPNGQLSLVQNIHDVLIVVRGPAVG